MGVVNTGQDCHDETLGEAKKRKCTQYILCYPRFKAPLALEFMCPVLNFEQTWINIIFIILLLFHSTLMYNLEYLDYNHYLRVN